MKRWLLKIVLTLLAVVAFPGAVLAVIAAQGRLRSTDVETFRQVPVVGDLLPPAEEPEPPLSPTGRTGPSRTVTARGPEDTPWRTDVEVDDAAGLLKQLRARRAFFDERLDLLEREREQLARLHAELRDREKILEEYQKRLATERMELDRDRQKLRGDAQIIEAGRMKALKDTAKAIAEMDSEKAAEALSGLDEDRAAMLLRVMDATAVGSILSEMKDPERRRQLLERYLGTIKADSTTGGK
jgi:flagellar motility protein MotE (MotC chaperone)